MCLRTFVISENCFRSTINFTDNHKHAYLTNNSTMSNRTHKSCLKMDMINEQRQRQTMCWSFSRWMMRDDHSDIGIASADERSRWSKQRAALCFTESIVSLHHQTQRSYINVHITCHARDNLPSQSLDWYKTPISLLNQSRDWYWQNWT